MNLPGTVRPLPAHTVWHGPAFRAGGSLACHVVAGALIIGCFLQVFFASRQKSPAFDEPVHIGAGLSYFHTREFTLNPQHPPLLKEIAAVPLLIAGVRWPFDRQAWTKLRSIPNEDLQWTIGPAVIFSNDPEKVMLWARLPFALLAMALGTLIYLWTRQLLGATAGIGALFLYALDPNIIAHAGFVTTDIGFAAFAFLFLFTLWHYLRRRSLKRLALCGLALGAALAAKFTGLALLPLAAILVFSALLSLPACSPRGRSSLRDPYAAAGRLRRFAWCICALGIMGLLAVLIIEAVYFFPASPLVYLRGLQLVNADHNPDYQAFLAGHFQSRFLTYFVAAFLLKEPLPALLLMAIGWVAILRRGATTWLDRLFLLLPPAVIFAGHTLLAANFGVRYVIPAMPFLHMAGGAGLAFLMRGRLAARTCAGALCGWLVIAAIGIYPDHLSYFNETACLLTEPSRIGFDGGSSCGPRWLDDSNVDWGQGLKQLRQWLDQHERDRWIHLAYFGTMRPAQYGILSEAVDNAQLLYPRTPGIYVLSAHVLARLRGTLVATYGPDNWLRHSRPVAVVGHAYYVYEVTAGRNRAGK